MASSEEIAWAPFERLREALQEIVGPLGLNIHDWIVFPDAKAMNVIMLVDPMAFLPDEERKTLEAFNEMMSEQQKHDLLKKQRAKVQNMLDQMTGVLGDVPPKE